MKKMAIINGGELLTSIINYFRGMVDITAVGSADDNVIKSNKFDLIIINGSVSDIDKEIFKENIVIRLQPSLLPAFDVKEPVKNAFLAGVKVSGVTVCRLNKEGQNDKIMAQFPVLIDYNSHFDEFAENMRKTEEMFYPIVIKQILENKPFSFSCIMGSGCNGDCGSCKS